VAADIRKGAPAPVGAPRDQDGLPGDLSRIGYVGVSVLADEEGDVRGIEATLPRSAP